MDIISFNRKTLDEFINSALYENLEQIPVSRHRAVSQINNPRCSDTDIIMVIALDNGVLAGYLGVLPDHVYHVGKKTKAGWLSCFWVNEAYRTSTLSATLLLEVMEKWDHQIMITNFVPSLARLYMRTGFFQPAIVKEGMRAYMRSDMAELLPHRSTRFKSLKPFLKIADKAINIAGSIRFLFFHGFKLDYIDWSYVELIDERISAFVKSKNNSWTRRGRAELQWIIDYPWIIQGGADHESSRYYFSSVSKRFINRLIMISDHGNITGFVMVTIRNNNMTVPYVFSESGFEPVCEILINIMLEKHLNMLTVFHDELVTALKGYSIPFLFKKPILKPYLVAKKLDFINEPRFNDGDGDCVFY